MKNKMKKKQSVISQMMVCFSVIISVVVGALFFIQMYTMDYVPLVYMLCFLVFMIILNGLTMMSLKWKKIIYTWIISIVSVIVSIILIIAAVMMSKLKNTLDQLSEGRHLEVTQIAIIVKTEDPAEKLEDVAGYHIGYVDEENTNRARAILNGKLDRLPVYTEYMNIIDQADALLEGKEEGLMINSAYVDMISELEGYENFSDSVKMIDYISLETYTEQTEILTENENESEKDQSSDEEQELKDTFVVYISGIDTWGNINVKSRSDVNILAAVNIRTGKIQLINTPRDYYIPLPVSNGKEDKLTHAGIYGIECSEGALEDLYGIKIDYYVRMNFSGFESIIDTLGGIDVYSEYDFTVSPVKHYVVGYNHLSGIEALAFARERHAFANGDIQRGKNQMEVVRAMINKLASPEFLYNYSEILEHISDCFQTNVPSEFIYTMVKNQLSSGTSWELESYTVTGEGAYQNTYSIPGYAVYVMLPDEKEVTKAKNLMDQVLNEE